MWNLLFDIQLNVILLSRIFPEGGKPGLLLFLVILIGPLFLALAAHELGHLLAGLLQGFRFELFIVGPLGIKRDNGKIKIYLNKSLGMMGGMAATVPTSVHPDNRKKFARLILWGPLASILFAAISFGALALTVPGAMRFFWLMAGACSFGLALATTIPRKSGVFFTDRGRYQRLMDRGKAGRNEEALLTIIAQNIMDNSCVNISVEQALQLQEDDESFVQFWGYFYEYSYYADNQMDEEAAVAKEKLLEKKTLIPHSIFKTLGVSE